MNRFLIPSSLLLIFTACDAPAPKVAPAGAKPALTAPAEAKPVAKPEAEAVVAGCAVGQQITLNISSTAPAGQGCQNGGGKAQGDSVHVFEVITTPDGQKGAKQIRPGSSGAT